MSRTHEPGVTTLPPPRWMRRVDTSVYTDDGWLEIERDRIFGRTWWIAAREQALPRPGDYVVRDELGASVVLIRDERGMIHAFDNSCRHRGSRLLDGRGRVDSIRCPYHGWTYGLDGRNSHIPAAEGLRGRMPAERGLHRIRCETWGGFAWVCLHPDTAPLADYLGGVVDDLAPYRLDEFEPIQSAEWELPCNWKALVENVTDFYHVPFVHRNTVAAHVPAPPDIQSFGDHTRQRLEIAAYGWRQRVDRRCSRGGPYSPMQASALHKYLLFPNTVINVLPYHFTVMQVFPITPRRTRFFYTFSKRRGARGLERMRAYSTWLASRYILYEDITLLEKYQRGLDTGRQTHQVLHTMEDASAHFHGTLQRYASEDPAPWTAGPAEVPRRA
ncbi:MAG: aromatic ring-hydroxylating dioxygenase subunit alpha [Myxococcota bacterium]|nr:aromatic ring-hydroxylating dioxygenase subunit alpha [Myxococcota bacterium]